MERDSSDLRKMVASKVTSGMKTALMSSHWKLVNWTDNGASSGAHTIVGEHFQAYSAGCESLLYTPFP
ncbi:hypothetical protein ACHAXS_005157 [Conticribra weissflogii]